MDYEDRAVFRNVRISSKSTKIHRFIKYYMIMLSLISTFSLGYLEYQSKSNIKHILQIFAIIALGVNLFLYKLDQLFVKFSLCMLIFIWIPQTQWLINLLIKLSYISILVIIFGQFGQCSGKWMFMITVTRIVGYLSKEFGELNNKKSFITIALTIIALICLYLLIMGSKINKNNYPLPIIAHRYSQHFSSLKIIIRYAFLFGLLSVGTSLSLINQFQFDFFSIAGFILPLLILIFLANPSKYNYLLFSLAIMMNLSKMIGYEIGLLSFGYIEGLQIIVLIEAMQIDRRAGGVGYLIGSLIGTSVPKMFELSKHATNCLELNGLGIILFYMIINDWMIRRQFRLQIGVRYI